MDIMISAYFGPAPLCPFANV